MLAKKQKQATEQMSFETSLSGLDLRRSSTDTVLRRLQRIRPTPPDAAILDVGAAQGKFLIACAERGLRAVGVEPWDEAREIGKRLSEHVGAEITIHAGTAETLPVESGSFDIVHANSVIEHVVDAQAAFGEACRVLKPGGIFWFSTASSMCPIQHEIDGFPLFGWYPNGLKRRIMEWAKTNRPGLVGHTQMPAIHWFTPRKARRMLREAGFSRIYDRWDLRHESEGGRLYRAALRVIKLSTVTKLAADVVVPDCSYAAVK
jgi:ubiquinone/menaquinone biosynthesis C-methylase UbiE